MAMEPEQHRTTVDVKRPKPFKNLNAEYSQMKLQSELSNNNELVKSPQYDSIRRHTVQKKNADEPLNLAKLHKKRQRRERIRKLVFFSFFILEALLVVAFIKFYSKKFQLGLSIAILFSLMNICYLLIYSNIIHNWNKPSNDPGIVIWWMCCLRLGQSRKFDQKLWEYINNNTIESIIQNDGTIKTYSSLSQRRGTKQSRVVKEESLRHSSRSGQTFNFGTLNTKTRSINASKITESHRQTTKDMLKSSCAYHKNKQKNDLKQFKNYQSKYRVSRVGSNFFREESDMEERASMVSKTSKNARLKVQVEDIDAS